MSPNRSFVAAITTLVVSLGSVPAAAADLAFTLVEDDQGATIQVRGFDDDAETGRRVVTSKDGMLFFFKGHSTETQRLQPSANRRLEYVQVGSNGRRTALRLAQRDGHKGGLASFVSQDLTADGVDIHIADHRHRSSAPARVESVPALAEPPSERDREETLAALEASLGAPPALPIAPSESDPGVGPEPAAPSSDVSLAAPYEADDDASVAAATTSTAMPNDPFAAQGPTLAPILPHGGATGSAWWTLAAAVLVALGTAAWTLQRRRVRTVPRGMEVVSRIGLGPRQQLLWVKAAGREFLVGATDQRVALLTELGDAGPRPVSSGPVSPPALEPAPVSDARVNAFKARLQAALGQELKAVGSPKALPADDDLDVPSHLRLLVGDPAWTDLEDAA